MIINSYLICSIPAPTMNIKGLRDITLPLFYCLKPLLYNTKLFRQKKRMAHPDYCYLNLHSVALISPKRQKMAEL